MGRRVAFWASCRRWKSRSGSGKGLFLAHATAAVPAHDFLGIEISRQVRSFRRRAAGPPGVRERQGRARGRRAAVSRPARRRFGGGRARVLSRSLVETAAPQTTRDARRIPARRATCAASGRRTALLDGCAEYFDTTLELIRQTTRLTGPTIPGERPSEHDLDYQTHFERRMRLQQLARLPLRIPQVIDRRFTCCRHATSRTFADRHRDRAVPSRAPPGRVAGHREWGSRP